MNQILLGRLEHRLWRAKPPGGKGRTIAAIFAHIHNSRCKWLRLSAPHLKPPPKLDRTRATPEQARAALAESAHACSAMIARALTAPRGGKFLRDGWARPWPAGVSMVIYMISHDVHHRGQVCLLADQLGSPLPASVGGEIWNWEKLWRECGFTHPR
ncbi:MAG: DinB family protein [Acidobacteriia bacterium]|nr:DinB family protein [Terriglobia bacterium]